MDSEKRNRLKIQLVAARSLQRAMEHSIAAANHPSDAWRFASYKAYMIRYNDIAERISKDSSIEVPVRRWRVDNVLDWRNTVGIQQKEYYDMVYADLSMLIGFLDTLLDSQHDERTALRDFLQANLRKTIFEKPDKESQVQDAIETLLIGRGLQKGGDYDREKGRVKVSIKETIPDFILPRLSLAVEVKLSKTTAKSKEIVDEINADIQAYGRAYTTMLFVVYDIGTIQNESEFKMGLETQNADIQVIVVKH